jgi:CheY-like chemotaxis protein
MHTTPNILLVEDDELDIEYIRRLFLKHGVKNTIYFASDGFEALDILRGENNRTKIKQPYIVLVDINMPKMNGLELLKEIRNDNNLKYDSVFMLTTSDYSADLKTAYSLNVSGYYLKKDILKLVNSLGETRH